MDGSRATPCIVVFLLPRVRLALVADWPLTSIRLNGQTYKAVGPRWSGFYDWLRDPNGILLGVRYHPCDKTLFVLRQASARSYAQLGSHSEVCLFFSDERSFDSKRSADQDFLYDQVLVADDGSIAIAFAKELTREELDGLRSMGAETHADMHVVYGERKK